MLCFRVVFKAWLFLCVGTAASCTISVIASTWRAFAAQKVDGTVITWGNSGFGGDSSSVASNLSRGAAFIAGNQGAFAAKMLDGSVVTWGYGYMGGDSSSVAGDLTGVDKVVASRQQFAALKLDGSVVTWGFADLSLVAGNLTSGVIEVVDGGKGLAARKQDGSLLAWGSSPSFYVLPPEASSGVVSLHRFERAPFLTDDAWWAVKDDGSVFTFGLGVTAPTVDLTGAEACYLTTVSGYAAKKTDGSVVTWGTVQDIPPRTQAFHQELISWWLPQLLLQQGCWMAVC